MPKSPEKPGDLNMQNLKYLRFVDPEDSTKLVQLALVNTGTVTADGTRIYTLGISAGGGAPLPITTLRPNSGAGGQLTMNGTALPLPAVVGLTAMYVWLQADVTNNGPINIIGPTQLTAGESIVIETDADASWITASGMNPDKLNYLIIGRV